jgi:hypothetical protein
MFTGDAVPIDPAQLSYAATIVDETPSEPWGIDEHLIPMAGPEAMQVALPDAVRLPDFNTVELRFYEAGAIPPPAAHTPDEAEAESARNPWLLAVALAALGLLAGIAVALLT